MIAEHFFDKNITEENCSWAEFEQCRNHQWTICHMMEEYAKLKVDEYKNKYNNGEGRTTFEMLEETIKELESKGSKEIPNEG